MTVPEYYDHSFRNALCLKCTEFLQRMSHLCRLKLKMSD